MKNTYNNPFVSALLFFCLLFAYTANAASPAAGTFIKNQASATYKDASGVDQVATSNLVETLIQQVGAMDLVQDQTRPGALGNTVYFSHVLTNTGNDVDSFPLTSVDTGGDQYDFTAIKIYADANRDGVADSTTEITTTGNLSAQEAFYFVVAATLPAAGPASGDQGIITINAVSGFDNTKTETNTDVVTVSDKAIVDVTKSMSAATGYSPSSIFTVSLSYVNNSTETASNVTLIDALPTGMSYVAGSAKWSETGTLVLTDNDKNDSQSGLTYCAYHNDCTGLSTNGVSTQQVTAIIASVTAGDSAVLTFDVQVAASVSASILHNTAYYEYDNGSVVVPRKPSNKVPFEVLPLPAVVANGSDTSDAVDADNEGGNADAFIVTTASLGEVVSFENFIYNKGNSTDTFDITLDASVANPFPANTVFLLYKQDGFTPLLDSNSNGTVDTGPIDVGSQYKVVLKAILPVNTTLGNNGGAGFNITKTATSSIDDTVSDSVTDRLGEINGDSYGVDITNNAALGNAGTGVGGGPEANPVTVVAANSGSSAVFNLYINNTGSAVTSYQLHYSMDNPFVAESKKTNWSITFHHDGGNNDCSTQGTVITSTGAIAASDSKQVCAVVAIPVDAIADIDGNGDPIKQSVYFQAISPTNTVSDIKHDAVIITETPNLSIAPDQQGQVQPGNTITYSHRITNNGNTALECINVTLQNSLTDWSSLVYFDTNADGKLDGGDVQLTDQVLNSGQSFSVLVKLFAPATAPMGTQNTTTLTLTGHKDDGDGDPATCNGLALTDSAKDVTTVNQSEVNIKKEQSVDNDCDGVSDSGIFLTSSFQVNPNACVIYRLTATNNGITAVNTVRIDDAAPAFTVFNTAGGLPIITHGNIEGGTAGNEGVISGGSVGGADIILVSGEKMVLTFGVKLD